MSFTDRENQSDTPPQGQKLCAPPLEMRGVRNETSEIKDNIPGNEKTTDAILNPTPGSAHKRGICFAKTISRQAEAGSRRYRSLRRTGCNRSEQLVAIHRNEWSRLSECATF